MRHMRKQHSQCNFGPGVFTGVALLTACGAMGQTAAVTGGITGGITGVVQTTDGKGVAKTTVAIRFRPASVAVKPPFFNSDVTTAADGTFAVKNAPDGTYAVCPAPQAATTLPPCNWETEPTVTVANGKITAMKAIVLNAGADLWVHVDDPQGKRASMEGKVPGASLLLVVRTPGGHPMHIPLTASGANGFEHHLTVPVGTDLVITAFSTVFGITNATGVTSAGGGAALPQGVSTAVNIPAGTTQHKEVITIH
jgi:hypothetical protein